MSFVRIRSRRSAVTLFATVVVTTGVLAAGMPPAFADPASDRAEQARYAVETATLRNDQFLQRKANFRAAGCGTTSTCTKPVPYNSFDWSTDSCSWTPSSLKALFDPACQEHDFGYRNFGKGLTLDRSESRRRWIDDRFRAEMKSICNYRFSDWTQFANLQACFKEADGMYAVVRNGSDWTRP